MGSDLSIAKLERVDLRKIWADEARDLTPWLASEDGLERLGEVLGLSLEIIGTEQPVGPFYADILARVSTDEDHKVVIENQLGRTDHDHLGKSITYAAGLGAKTVVWISPQFTEEHRQALDWLNERAGEDVSFFGLEIRAFRIEGSRPAPQFSIISSPNETTKKIRETVQAVERKTYDELMALANDRQVGNAAKALLTLTVPPNDYVWATPSRAWGGSFRCWRRGPDGKPRMILGINISGERKKASTGQLDIWLPIPSIAFVSGASIDVVTHLFDPFTKILEGDIDWIIRIRNEDEARQLAMTLSEFFEKFPGDYYTAQAK